MSNVITVVFFVGYGYVVCGDEKGSLWTYHITDAMIENLKSGKTISVTEVCYLIHHGLEM